MTIQITDAQGLYRKYLIATYIERIAPTKFLESFFRVEETTALELSLFVERNFEKVAVDVLRGTDGNRNRFSLSTEKIFIPPYFREYFDITNLDMYKKLLAVGADSMSESTFGALINEGVTKMQLLVDKIDRAYELMRASVLETGIVTMDQGDQIDFKRKAASLVDLGAGQYFTDAINPFSKFATGAGFLRTKGKSTAANYQAIMGDLAATALFGNAEYIRRKNEFNHPLDAVNPPQRDAQGAAYHGRITAESYTVDLWTYPQSYDNDSNDAISYIDTKKIVMIPQNPNFVMAYAGVPQLLTNGKMPEKGKFIFTDYIDEKRRTHEFHVESAGIPIPVAVDQIYTMQVVA